MINHIGFLGCYICHASTATFIMRQLKCFWKL